MKLMQMTKEFNDEMTEILSNKNSLVTRAKEE